MVAMSVPDRTPDLPGRACVIGITSAGAALIDAVRQDNASRLAECVVRLDPADLAVMAAALPVLESLAQQVACRAGTGPGAAAATLA